MKTRGIYFVSRRSLPRTVPDLIRDSAGLVSTEDRGNEKVLCAMCKDAKVVESENT